MQTIQDLINEMQSYGLLININKVIYSKIDRCPTKTKPRVNNGWYIVHCNGDLITAFYGDYQKGAHKIKWCNKRKLSKLDKSQQIANYLHYKQQLELEI